MSQYLASGERLGLRVKPVTPSTGQTVTTNEAKKQAQVTASGDDTHIDLLIAAAEQLVERDTGHQLLDATYDLFVDRFPVFIRLPFPPLDSVTTVKYFDTAGVQQTLTSSEFQLDDAGEVARIYPGIDDPWPSTQLGRINAVEVRFVTGYGDAGDVPELLKHCVRELVSEAYWNRIPPNKVGAGTIPMPMHAKHILEEFKVYGW